MSRESRRTTREEEHISLCETLDRVLNKGVVVAGEVVISVADIDLIYLGLQLVLTSVETARQAKQQKSNLQYPIINPQCSMEGQETRPSALASPAMSSPSIGR